MTAFLVKTLDAEIDFAPQMDVGALLGRIGEIVVLVLVGAAGTLLAQRFLEKKPDLRYRIISTGDLLPPKEIAPVAISINGQKVEELVAISCEFTNHGNLHVENVPFKWTTRRSGWGDQITVSATPVDRILLIPGESRGEIRLLNPKESVTVTWLFADEHWPLIGVEARRRASLRDLNLGQETTAYCRDSRFVGLLRSALLWLSHLPHLIAQM